MEVIINVSKSKSMLKKFLISEMMVDLMV